MKEKKILYVFAISHFCEKARWALDYRGIPYEVAYIAPGLHRKLAERLGASSSSVPFLTEKSSAGEETLLVQGSSTIIDYAEKNGSGRSLEPSGADVEELRGIEKSLDERAGVHIRRYFYSDALIHQPSLVKPLFYRGLNIRQRLFLLLAWKKMRTLMIRYMDLGEKQFEESRGVIESLLDELDITLSDKQYLAGERFSRIDLTAASLLAPLVNPAEHPTYQYLVLPNKIAKDVKSWEARPTLQWLRSVYSKYRN